MSDPRLTRLGQVEERRPEFLWPDRIPLGGLTILDGDPGCGKSTVTNDIAARVTTGSPMPDSTQRSQPAGVVLLSGEDSLAQDVKPRLRALGADLDRILVVHPTAHRTVSLPDDMRLVETAVEQIGAKLVVIDPITSFFGGNLNHDQSVRKALGPLAELADRRNLAVVLIRHLTKSGRGNPLYRGAGSIGIIGAARSGLIVGNDPACDDKYQHVLAHYKGNRGSAGSLAYRTVRHNDRTITIQWLGASDCQADDIIVVGPRHERTALQEAVVVLREVLSDGPMPAKEVVQLATDAQIAKRTLMRAKAQLRVRSRKIGDGPHAAWLWELPEGMDTLMDRLINGPPAPIPGGRDVLRRRRRRRPTS